MKNKLGNPETINNANLNHILCFESAATNSSWKCHEILVSEEENDDNLILSTDFTLSLLQGGPIWLVIAIDHTTFVNQAPERKDDRCHQQAGKRSIRTTIIGQKNSKRTAGAR